MKKLLIFMLVLGMSSVASATTVGLYIDPGAAGGSRATQLSPSGTATVYITVDTTGPTGSILNLGTLDAVISIDGGGATGTIVDAIKVIDLPAVSPFFHPWGAYGWQLAPGPPPIYGHMGGWQAALSFDPAFGAGNQSVEIGMGQNGAQVYDTTLPPFALQPPDWVTKFNPWYNGPVGYIEIHCLGAGDITVSLAPGFAFGGTAMDDGVTVPNFGASTTVYQVPEPMTVLLFGLGGLFLRRRK